MKSCKMFLILIMFFLSCFNTLYAQNIKFVSSSDYEKFHEQGMSSDELFEYAVSEDVEDKAKSLRNLGAYYIKKHLTKNYIKSRNAYLKSLEFDQTQDLRGYAHYMIGEINQKNLANFRLAEFHLQKAIEILLNNDQHGFLGACYRELGTLYRKRGDIERSTLYFNIAIEKQKDILAKKDTAKKQKQMAKAYHAFGNLLEESGDFKASISNLKKAIEINKATGSDIELTKNYISLADVYDRLGKQNNENYNKAISFYKKAAEVSDVDADIIQNNIGITYLKSKQFGKAKNTFEQALNLSESKIDSAIVYNNLGDYYLYNSNSNFEKALANYQKAIVCSVSGFNNAMPSSNPDKSILKESIIKKDLLTFLSEKAICWLKYYESETQKDRNKLDAALAAFQAVDSLVDLMIFDYGKGTKLFWRKELKLIYEQAVKAAYERENDSLYFYFLERSKAILLLEQLELNTFIENLNETHRNILENIYSEIITYREALNEGYDENASIQLIEAENKLQSTLKEKYPAYYESMNVVEMSEASQKLLNDSTILVNYFFGKEAIYAIAINSRGETNKHKIIVDKQLEKDIEEYIKLFEREIDKVGGVYQDLANKLYEKIYHPIIKPWKGQFTEAIIIPDDQLSFIPFDALVPYRKENYAENLHYLIDEQCTRYAYSTTTLVKQKASVQNTRASLLSVFPAFEKRELDQEQIPDSKRLHNSISAFFSKENHKSLYYEKATLDAFKKYAANYSIIHIHSHALGRGMHFPKIYLIDSLLTLRDIEILNVSKYLDLVILSACESNLGKIKSGEGVYSLANGFAHKGAKSIIAGLWELNEDKTPILFSSFYQSLKEGKTKGRALHEAKKKYLSELRNSDDYINMTPDKWAGYVFIGADNTLTISDDSYSSWWYYLFGSLLVFGLVAWRFKK